MIFDYYKDEQILRDTVYAIEKYLLDKSPSGGTPRYEHDQYFVSDPPYMGNPWFITTFWLAQYYIRIKEPDKALAIIQWAQSNTLPSGVMSEQIHPKTGHPTSVAPLVWSHSEYINTVLDLARHSQD